MGRRAPILLTVVALLAAVMPLPAQRIAKRIFIEAVDDQGQPLLNLTAADLTIIEDGSPRDVTRVTPGTVPMRIALVVDSSTSTAPMMTIFRQALVEFADALPPPHEVVFVSSGSQIRVRTPPSTDRQQLKTAIGMLASEGGANAFLETVIETDARFLKTAAPQWPVFVILTTDIGEARREPDIPRYNRFMNDFLARGGNAHAIVMQGKQFGPVTDITQNLVQNLDGIYLSLVVDSGLPYRLRSIAERVAADHRKMATWHEVEFTGESTLLQPTIEVGVNGDGVRVRMSARRPAH